MRLRRDADDEHVLGQLRAGCAQAAGELGQQACDAGSVCDGQHVGQVAPVCADRQGDLQEPLEGAGGVVLIHCTTPVTLTFWLSLLASFLGRLGFVLVSAVWLSLLGSLLSLLKFGSGLRLPVGPIAQGSLQGCHALLPSQQRMLDVRVSPVLVCWLCLPRLGGLGFLWCILLPTHG